MSGEARYGRRDNGLIAAEYSAAGDVDPRVGEHLLDVLALEGIAAYLRPSSDMHPVTRSSTLPRVPTDRLYVDRAHLATARDYLAKLLDEPAAGGKLPGEATDEDSDAAFSAIVAGFGVTVDDQQRSWPAAEDLTEDPESAGRQGSTRPLESADTPGDMLTDVSSRSSSTPSTPSTASTASSADHEPSLLDGLDTFGANLPDEDEGGYTPPEPPPLPRPSGRTVLAVIGIGGGLVLFLRPDLLPVGEGMTMFLGAVGIVGGFGSLVWRLRPGNDDDDVDPDDGARV